jgi:hypothetical protein
MADFAPDSSTPRTAGELWHRREKLEQEASLLLGSFLFGFSRLEFAASLAIESLRRNRRLLREPAAGSQAGMFNKLIALADSVAAMQDIDAGTSQAYEAWTRAAHVLRSQRNALVHGRWDVDPERELILNIATHESGTAKVTEYDLSALRQLAEQPAALHRQLSKLLSARPI